MLTGKISTESSHHQQNVTEPQSAHATKIVAHYVEKRKKKAEKQSNQEREKTSFATDEWKKLEYVIF